MWPWFFAGDKGETIVVACVGCWPWYVNFMRLPQARTLVQLAISSAACTSKYICVQRWAHSLTIIWNHMLVSWPCSSGFFLLCCTEQTHNKALGLLSNSTLIMTYVLWHSDSIYHLHSSQLQTQSSEHEDMKLISNWFPRPNQRADQNKDFEAFITIYERVTRQCHLLCFWWLAPGMLWENDLPMGQIVTCQDQGLDWVGMRAWLRPKALLRPSGIKSLSKNAIDTKAKGIEPRLWRPGSREILQPWYTATWSTMSTQPLRSYSGPPETYWRLKSPPSKSIVVPVPGFIESACMSGLVGS